MGMRWDGKFKKYYDMQMTVLVAEAREYLQHIMNEFDMSMDRMGLQINDRKSKLFVVKKDQRRSYEKMMVSGK